MTRPFQVLGIQQIAIGGPDKARLRTLWVDMLGLDVIGNFRSERENVDEDICAIGQGVHRVEVDLMQPLDPDKSRRCTVPRSTMSGCGLMTCPPRWHGSLGRACALRRVASARARPAMTSALCTRNQMTRSRLPAKACSSSWQAPPEVVAALRLG